MARPWEFWESPHEEGLSLTVKSKQLSPVVTKQVLLGNFIIQREQ